MSWVPDANGVNDALALVLCNLERNRVLLPPVEELPLDTLSEWLSRAARVRRDLTAAGFVIRPREGVTCA